MTDVKMRPAKKGDLKKIADMVSEIWGHGGNALMEERYGKIGGKSWSVWTTQEITGELKKILPQIAVTEVDGEIAGFASYLIDRKKSLGTVGYNGVNTRFQGLGIGGRQLKWVLAQLRKKGLKYAQVITGLNEGHAPARKMYERAGFQPLARNIIYTMKL